MASSGVGISGDGCLGEALGQRGIVRLAAHAIIGSIDAAVHTATLAALK